MWGLTVLNKVARDGLTQKVAFEQSRRVAVGEGLK